MNKLIVVGAGGSRELDMPTGYQLIQRIIQGIEKNEDYVIGNGQGQFLDSVNQFLHLLGMQTSNSEEEEKNRRFFERNLIPFRNSLQRWASTGKSLDAFLNSENVNEVGKQFGKFVIAYYILGQEEWLIRENLYAHRDNWLRIFIEQYLLPIKDDLQSGKCPVKIITFNYDRNIEHFLYTFLRHVEPRIPGWEQPAGFDKAKSIIDLFDIQHVYNPLAPLEWQNRDGEFIRFGERNNDKHALDYASKAIQLIGENGAGRVPGEKIAHIRQMVHEADRIYFLGVGFDLDNMKILFGDDVVNPGFRSFSDCHATAIGLNPAISQQFPFITFHHLTCAQLVQNRHIFSL